MPKMRLVFAHKTEESTPGGGGGGGVSALRSTILEIGHVTWRRSTVPVFQILSKGLDCGAVSAIGGHAGKNRRG